MDVDDGDLLLLPVDFTCLRFIDLCSTSNEVADVKLRSPKTAFKRGDSTRCSSNRTADVLGNVVHQVVEVFASDGDIILGQPGFYSCDHGRQLAGFIVRLGK